MHPLLPALSLLCVLPLLGQTPAQPRPALPTTLQNGSFEAGNLGQLPKGWFVPKPCVDSGFRCELAEDPVLPRKRSALLFHEGTNTGAFGNLMQMVNATPYGGSASG